MARPIVLCGPSGAGKSTLINKLFKTEADKFGFSISHTSRNMRAGETDGVQYHFKDRKTILDMVAQGLFLENAEYSGNLYGDVLSQGKNVILDIDMQGVIQLQKKLKEDPKLLSADVTYIFIAPPSLEILESRLTNRGTETSDSLKLRLEVAKEEMKWAQTSESNIHHYIVNEDVDKAYVEFRKALLLD
ncbi:hypothetical protein HDV02_004014 [Globomyces sp. JEL0801]|nr:hypothetical protein HDV02_004014 [Globomyces sp. JEL0801]